MAEYENWAIGYMMPTLDSDGSGLIESNKMNLEFGTYLQFDGDGNIYDAATLKNVFDPVTGEAIDGAFESDVTEFLEEIDPNLDESILTDLDLSGITPLKISQILDGGTVDEYFVVDWSYGDTARPSFTFYWTGTSSGNQYYFVSYNGDKAPIKDKFQVKGGAISEGHENLISDMITTMIGGIPDVSEPTFNFKKVKKRKINFEDLSVFGQTESDATADIATTTTTTSY